MKITKEWAMPHKNTFEIEPIRFFIEKHNQNKSVISIDPFANKNRIAGITNDLNPEFNTDFNMDALKFLQMFPSDSVGLIFYDPPYSPRQVSECYKSLGMTVNMETTQASFWGSLKKEISRVCAFGGIVLSFGWNSNGIGMTNGFSQIEILIVSHGGQHNDTICTAEKKVINQIRLF